MIKKSIALVLFILIEGVVHGQHFSPYFIKNYNRKDYAASISNFNVIEDSNGLIYAGNYYGVLTFNGRWNLINLPENPAVHALSTDQNNCIYLGFNNDFGYLSPDASGKAEFISLKPKITEDVDISDINQIISTTQGIFFYSKNNIFCLNENEIKIIKAGQNPFGFSLFKLDDHPVYIQNKMGLMRLEVDMPHLILSDSLIPKKSPITYIDSLRNNNLLIGSALNGLFRVTGDSVESVSAAVSTYLSSHTLYTGIRTKLGDSTYFIFGTFRNGLVKTDEKFKSFTSINKTSGLQSDIVKGLEIDQHEGLWAAMQEGISRIEINSPWMHWNHENGLEGTPWDAINYKGTLYVATTSGLFYLEKGLLNKVRGLKNKVWSLSIITPKGSDNAILLAGGESGLFKINSENQAERILKIPNISKIYTKSRSSEKAIVGSLAGINEVHSISDKFFTTLITDSSAGTFNDILIDEQDNLWLSIKFKGIYKLSKEKVTLFNKEQGLPDVNKISIITIDDKLLFATNHGIYRLKTDEEGSTIFTRDSTLFADPVNIGVMVRNKKNEFFVSLIAKDKKEHIEKLIPDGKGGYIHETTPFKRLPEMEIIDIYPDPEEEDVTWIAGSEGLFRYDEKVKKDYTLPFNTVISKVSVSDSAIFNGFYPTKIEGSDIPGISIEQPDSYKPTMTYDNNNITFEYSATSYEMPEKNQYSYFLENNDKGWSGWAYETKKEYSNLAAGRYIFHVRSKNIYDTVGREITYEFTIQAPWYQTAWAYGIFTVLGAFLVWVITMAYSLRVRLQRKKLRLIVADRTYEVMSQKKEIEQQNQLLIAQKTDIENKNAQLKESQEEIMSMNQKLTELNLHLEKKVEKRTSKIKDTLKKLQQINGELDTFVYRASHDLKGPISRIHGITSLAKLESPDDINLKYFGLIEDTAKDMEALLSKLAQVHEIINATVSKAEIDIPSLLSEVRDNVKFLDKGHKTKYTFDLEKISLHSDSYLLSIVIKNIIENALIFRKADGEHHIHFSTSSDENYFKIVIRDNGIGINPSHYNRVFHMFFRGSDKSKGSGLGLYLVQMCLEKLNGNIQVESNENEFTEFTISIPF